MVIVYVITCSDTDVHTVASLLKLYLRELPEPVVPWTQYQDFLDCTNLMDVNSSNVHQLKICLITHTVCIQVCHIF